MEAESVIGLGEDLHGEKIPHIRGYTDAMARLKYILENHESIILRHKPDSTK